MIPSANSLLSAAAAVAGGLLLLRLVLSLKSLLYLLARLWRLLDERSQAYQIYKIPQFADAGDGGGGQQMNPLYRRAVAYVSSLPSLEDSDFTRILSTGRKPNDFYLQLDPGQSVADAFRGARLAWSRGGDGCLCLRVRRQDRHRVLRPYLHHVETVADEIEAKRREVRLFTNRKGSWGSVPFTHPATLDTVAMDADLKARVRADLESFLKSRGYYARLGRVWRRSYLLYGPTGTGKSTFVAAMAKLLSYDVYDLDLSQLDDSEGAGADLKSLLLQTTPKSVVLVEDLDRYLTNGEHKEEKITTMLNFMDGVFSCCGEERVMVFTMSAAGKEAVDPALLRPGRLDVHIYFPLCDFSAFKTLAGNYLGLKDHKLYPQAEEVFQSGGAKLSPAEVGEIMIANRGSPSRAIKTVISALHQSPASSGRRTMSECGSVNGRMAADVDGCGAGAGLGFGKDATVREFKKLYGLIRRSGSKRDGTMSVEVAAAAAAAANAAAGTVVAKDGQ